MQGLSHRGHLCFLANETHVGDSQHLQKTENRHSLRQERALWHQQKQCPTYGF